MHVHGWGGHDAMGSVDDLDGMARALLRHGVTSFLPTAVTNPFPVLQAFADRVRAWLPAAPANGAAPLGFNIEGPFISEARKGAHNPAFLAVPADVPWSDVEPLVEGLRLITVAPEIPGGLDLIRRLPRPGDPGVDRAFRGGSRGGTCRVRRGWLLDNSPVQRDDRPRASESWPRCGGPDPR